MAAAGRAAIQRRAPPTSEAAALPGGLPVFAAVADEGNKILQEAAPIALLQVCSPLHGFACFVYSRKTTRLLFQKQVRRHVWRPNSS